MIVDGADTLCDKWAACLAERSDELLALLTRIATRDSAAAEIGAAQSVLRGGPAEIARARGPRGGRVCTFLPSNNVLYSYVLFGLIPRVWSDEVLIRPSARVKDVVLALHELLRDLPGRPVRIADVSQRRFVELCADAAMVVFTGRYDNLQRVRERIPAHVPILGFGSGPNPVVAGPAADVRQVVGDTVPAKLFNGGQDCLCPDLLIAHSSVYGEVRAALVDALGRIPRAPREQAGLINPPLFYADAYAAAAEFVEAHRGRVRSGGRIEEAAHWIEPTVVEFPRLATTHPPELFSPVICLTRYEDAAEVRDWLSGESEAERGMYVSVYGEPALAEPVLGTSVNCGPRTSFDTEDGNRPFGGYGRRASARWQYGRASGRPLLLSREAAAPAAREEPEREPSEREPPAREPRALEPPALEPPAAWADGP